MSTLGKSKDPLGDFLERYNESKENMLKWDQIIFEYSKKYDIGQNTLSQYPNRVTEVMESLVTLIVKDMLVNAIPELDYHHSAVLEVGDTSNRIVLKVKMNIIPEAKLKQLISQLNVVRDLVNPEYRDKVDVILKGLKNE